MTQTTFPNRAVPYRQFLEAGRQWSMPVPIRKSGRDINLELNPDTAMPYNVTAEAKAPDGTTVTATVTIPNQLTPEGTPDDYYSAAMVTLPAASTGQIGRWELRVYVEGEPAEWYRMEAHAAL